MSSEWVINSPAPSRQSRAYSAIYFNLFGGPGLLTPGSYIERTYSPLVSHSSLTYLIELYFFEEWDPLDSISLQIDSNNPLIWSNLASQDIISGYYGSSPAMGIMALSGSFNHTASSLTLRLKSNIANVSSTASFGISDLRINLRTDVPIISTGSCVNDYGQFFYYSPSCKCADSRCQGTSQAYDCDSSTSFCFGPSANDAYSCSYPGSFNGITCLESCADSNCLICADNGLNCGLCSFAFYLNWDYTCLSTCNAPYISTSKALFQYCDTPCKEYNTYMLWDNTCVASCDSPYLLTVKGRGEFCGFPCSSPSTEYLYPNGSCMTTCTSYPRVTPGYMFCDICPIGQFLYPNGSCYSTCSTPFKERQDIGGFYFCDFSCLKAGMKYYSVDNKACQASCNYPYSISDTVYCVLMLSSDEIKQVENIAITQNTTGVIGSTAAIVVSLVSSTNPGAFALIGITRMLQYIKYINVKYPPVLQKILQSSDNIGGVSKYIPPMPTKMQSSFPKLSLAINFEQYKLHSSFLVNFWQSLMTLLILFSFILISLTLGYCTKKDSFLSNLSKKLKSVFIWNFSIMFFTTFFDQIILFTALDITTLSLRTYRPVLSLLVCLILNTITITVIIKAFQIIKHLRDLQGDQNLYQESPQGGSQEEGRGNQYEVIFKSFKTAYWRQQIFLPVSLVRMYAFYSIVAYMYEYPLVQGILTVVLSLTMFLYLVTQRPPNKKIQLAQYIVQEIVVFLVSLCVLILAVLDKKGNDYNDARYVLGNIIIGCNTFIQAAGTAFLVIGLLITGWEYLKIRNSKKRQRRVIHPEIVLNSKPVPKVAKPPLDISWKLNGTRLESKSNFDKSEIEIEPDSSSIHLTASNVNRSNPRLNIPSSLNSLICRNSVAINLNASAMFERHEVNLGDNFDDTVSQVNKGEVSFRRRKI